MRLSRLLVVVQKDLAELRSSRFTLASVIALPIVLAVIVPSVSLLPLAAYAGSGGPLPIPLHITQFGSGLSEDRAALSNVHLERSSLTNSSVFGSYIGNSTLVNVFVDGSVLFNDSLINCVVRDSNLYRGSTDTGTVLIGSVVVGAESPLRVVVDQLLNFYLFFFVVIPVAIPSVLASYTIVGEKVNRTLEPLLASPLSDGELLAGKCLAILIPSLLATWGAFGLFSLITVADLNRIFGSSPVPNLTWYLTIFLVTPLVCVLSIAVNVLISSRVSDVRLSQQLGSLIILPLLVVFVGGFVGFFLLGPAVIVVFAAFLLAADLGVLALATHAFHREEILVRWK